MDKFVVAIFPDEKKAYEGIRALNQLHEEGSITLWGTAVVRRGEQGALEIRQQNDQGPIGFGVGAFLGTLVGVFGGPVGAAIGLAAGSVAGGTVDLAGLHLSSEFLDSLKLELKPGDYAVAAEISEEWIAPLDTRMDALGAKVLREPKAEFAGNMFEKWAAARKKELADRRKELADRIAQRKTDRASNKSSGMEAKLESEIDKARKKLQRSLDETQKQLDETRQELKAKMAALQSQAEKADPETKKWIDLRTTELREDLEEREHKLERAYDLTWQAINA